MRTTDQQRIATLTAEGQWGDKTLHGLLKVHVNNRPDTLAIKDQPNRGSLAGGSPQALSWAQLDRASDNLALQLQATGLKPGDRVIVQLPNVVELMVAYYTLSKMGAIMSPVPIQYGSYELQHMRETLEAAALITIGRWGKSELAASARTALPGLTVLSFGEDLHLDTSARKAFSSGIEDDANRIVTICWTSGTTGTPKGVPRSHNMWLATGRSTAKAGDYTPDDILLCPFPMVNMSALGGFVFPSAIHGCAVVLHHPLDPPLFLQQIQDERVSFSVAPPALLNQLAKSPDMWREYDLGALRRVGSGSALLSPWMIETFSKEFGVEVVNMYGSNEGIALYATPETAPDPTVRAAMFPRPAEGGVMQAKVVDPESGVEVTGEGERGELLVSGATVFDGYLGSDNEEVFDEQGYFRTGDLVEICGASGGAYKVVGRCKDIINRGGMKISPVELDVALEGHPDIAEGAVCAYPDDRLGEKICACLVMEPGVELITMEALQGHLLGLGLAKFKLPERIEAFEKLPRNAVGKIQRFILEEQVAKEG